MIETFRNQIRQFFEIYALLLHLLHMCHWCSLLIRHNKDLSPRVISINLGNIYSWVIFEDLSAPFCITGLNVIVELSGEISFKGFGKPLILELGEESTADVDSDLDHLEITRYLFFDESVLDLDAHYFSVCSKPCFVNLS